MPVRLSRVSFAWPGAPEALFSDLDHAFPVGWTAVLGPNGAGKSTLLELIAGTRSPSAGHVRLEGHVHRVPQDLHAPDAHVCALADATDQSARRWLGRLRLDPATLSRWPTLSPGERRRWQLAAALAASPDVLLVDEPTNHLDADARGMLITALPAFRGVGVVVTHDRTLGDALARHTLHLADGRVTALSLGPSDAVAELARRERSALDALEQTQRREAHARSALRARTQLQASTARDRRGSARMKNVRDGDATSMSANFRAAEADRKAASALHRARTAHARAVHDLDALGRPRTLGSPLLFRHEPAPHAVLWSLAREDVRSEDRVVRLACVDLALHRGAHVHVAGPNGAGKSTLVRAMVASRRLPPDRVLVVPQAPTPEDVRGWVQALHALPGDDRDATLRLVAALGADPARVRATPTPSPGEARKLALAMGLARDAWALVLDEPTNDLDLPSVLRLQEALAAFRGALLLVTHDTVLADACCTTRWVVRDGRVTVEGVQPADPR